MLDNPINTGTPWRGTADRVIEERPDAFVPFRLLPSVLLHLRAGFQDEGTLIWPSAYSFGQYEFRFSAQLRAKPAARFFISQINGARFPGAAYDLFQAFAQFRPGGTFSDLAHFREQVVRQRHPVHSSPGL